LERLLYQSQDIERGSVDLKTWTGNVKIALAEYYGEDSVVYRQFTGIRFFPSVAFTGQPKSDFTDAIKAGLNQAKGFLESRIRDLKEDTEPVLIASTLAALSATAADSKKVFVVHGHDDGTKEKVARYLTKLGLEPVILHEQPNQGRTIIEKFEDHATEVACAVVLLTADDIGGTKGTPQDKLQPRARQNVIIEFGYFAGLLGRKRAFALVEPGVELPSDLKGLIYISLTGDAEWRLQLVREFKAAGIEVDANQAF